MLIILTCFVASLLIPPTVAHAEREFVNQSPIRNRQPINLASDRYRRLFSELREQHGFTPQQLTAIFSGVTINKQVLDLMESPGEAKPYYDYRNQFVTQAMIQTGRSKMRQYKVILDRIERELGVDRQFVVAIWGIETHFGQSTGNFNVFQVLNTLFDAYPRRSDFFRQELIEFLLLCRESGLNPHTVQGSYAGAFGQTQFMPSSFRKYAMSFSGGKHPDVFHSTADVLASIANYLRQFGWRFRAPLYADIGDLFADKRDSLPLQTLIKACNDRKSRVSWRQVTAATGRNIPRPADDGPLTIVGLERRGGGMRYLAAYRNFQAITDWNNSNRYAMAVTELAETMVKP